MSTKIEWCDETINPLGHGCYGPGGTAEQPKICLYCYARTIAKRNMRNCELCKRFIPHTHFEQLEKLQQWKKSRNIFMQSMGDLFGDWVPDEWIQEVFKACEAAPWHRYLFLTKNPGRYERLAQSGKLPYIKNIWYGSTITTPDNEYYYDKIGGEKRNRFLSIEPLLAPFDKIGKMWTDWVIIGAKTDNRKDKIIPKREWIENIVEQCRAANVPVFMKNSLAGIWGEELIQEYPW